MWKQRVKESNWNIIVKWLNKKIISKADFKSILEMQDKLLKKKKL
jgi:hypothetical protein